MESWKIVPGGIWSKGVWVVISLGEEVVVPGGKIRFKRKSIEFSSSGFHFRLFVRGEWGGGEHMWICAADIFC